MADQKCAHPPCSCKVSNGSHGSYCSEACRQAGDKATLTCHCGHPGCAGGHS